MKSSLALQITDFMYNKLPMIYRRMDTKKQLYRYLQAIFEGGLKPTLEAIGNIINLVDPATCPAEFLPILCEQFGLIYLNEVPEKFHRKLLQNIVHLYKIKGTKPCLEFLGRELSGYPCKVVEVEGKDEFELQIYTYDDGENPELLLLQDIINKYVYLFSPVYINCRVIVSYEFDDDMLLNGSNYTSSLKITEIMNEVYKFNLEYIELTMLIKETTTEDLVIPPIEESKLVDYNRNINKNFVLNRLQYTDREVKDDK